MPCENSARKRSKTMAFRCTPEAQAHMRDGSLSGMSRQDYIIAKLTDTSRGEALCERSEGAEGLDGGVGQGGAAGGLLRRTGARLSSRGSGS